MLQLREHFSYLNSLRSLCVQIIDLLLLTVTWKFTVTSACQTALGCLLEINNLVTMATTIWSSCIGYIIMSTLSCHVYEGHTYQNVHLRGKYMVEYLHISPNSHYILFSPNPMAFPKPILLHLNRRLLRPFSKNLFESKHQFCFWESKGQATLVITFMK